MNLRLSEAWAKMVEKLQDWFQTFIASIPNIIIAIIVFFITFLASKYISRLVLSLLGRSHLNKTVKNLISKMVSIAVILLGLFMVLGILNLSKMLNTILAGAGVAGLAISLALQGALTNTYSGIILSFVKAVKLGNWVETNGYSGELTNLDLRAVTIKEIDNNLVYIPNKLVLENPIKNYSLTEKSRVIVNCGVAYDSDLQKVEDLVIKTIKENFPDLDEEKSILFMFEEFGGSSINFELRFWVAAQAMIEIVQAKSKAIKVIKKAFDQNDIEIPFPIRTLYMPKGVNVNSPSTNQNKTD
ncbi:mechanosensitive ion channel family protein [Aquimarina sp. ERC-38]|uniref:mechanosensitive ion channel family protein n=1 Tax=Aquimarina sp. ERC-38 TaxID=2949996 RepID=UPI0022461AA4|nr:mechanosensitive ion channel family protein [Aquimarina sp. ERC-38]UZO82475.1 mechanosensitive ion channel family protein [Aquimarina sp. ERC-38]